ncbi:MAG: hypothetical protein H6551_12875 [Chitinophagales bacterium]|nr:hypothetical protein [Chitinophagaceae bacterium]MCB9066025.1 hypothetical protein [Chitinophagales bacterium]
MKRIIASVILVLSVWNAEAQERQLGLMVGPKFNGEVAVGMNYYWQLSQVLVGPSVEGHFVSNVKGSTTTLIAPGANIALRIKMPYGFIYPGVTGHYRFGKDYNGLEFGATLGGVLFITPWLGVNFETGYRFHSGNDKGVYQDPVVTGLSGVSGNTVPVLLGLRYKFVKKEENP